MGLTVLLLALGLSVLMGGAELLVRGASRLAVRLGFSTLFIGLTVVSIATSLPELVVSLLATLRRAPDLATGTVVGSNIANIGLVLGTAALACPISMQLTRVGRDLAISILATLAFAGLAIGGRLGRPEAALLFAALLAYLLWAYRIAHRDGEPPKANYHAAARIAAGRAQRATVWKSLAQIVMGLGLLFLGAHLAVKSALAIAHLSGLKTAVIGLTIVATGTSLPELATSMVAAIKREPALAVGNVLGSNIFNLLGILGVAGMVRPLEISPDILRYDVPVALGFSLLCFPLIWTGQRISRLGGLLLILAYGVYTAWLITSRGPVA